MTLTEFNQKLETFGNAFLLSKNTVGYSASVIQFINDFYEESLKKSKETLVTEMLNFVTEVRSAK